MKIIWTKEAFERLIEMEDYISKDSPERAARFVDKIVDHAELLSNNTQLGRMVPETANPIIRELIFKKHRIVYRLKKDTIEILTVFEGHMLLRIDEAGF